MNRIYLLAPLAALAASPALTGCGGHADPPSGASATTSATVTCVQARPVIQVLDTAEEKLDASQQTINADVQYDIALAEGIAIINADRWPATGSQLNQDLHQFESDASQFTSGGQVSQQDVAADISALEADCDIPGGN
jgi:hypothetical protein